jgi:hypothetical protein
MTNNILDTIGRHKQKILIAVGILALVAYMLPFDSMYDFADAQKKGKRHGDDGYKKDRNGSHPKPTPTPTPTPNPTFSATNTAANSCLGPGTTCLAGAQQTLLFSNFNFGSTSFSFTNTAANSCSGGAFCQAQAIQYGFFSEST